MHPICEVVDPRNLFIVVKRIKNEGRSISRQSQFHNRETSKQHDLNHRAVGIDSNYYMFWELQALIYSRTARI